jgi:hypothetical protein
MMDKFKGQNSKKTEARLNTEQLSNREIKRRQFKNSETLRTQRNQWLKTKKLYSFEVNHKTRFFNL